MTQSETVVEIPTRLEEPGRIFVFEKDELLMILGPFLLGLIMKKLIIGAIFAGVLYLAWTRVKGDQGLYRLHAIRYRFFPKALTGLSALPDSAVARWNA